MKSLDHCVILVRDLDLARADYVGLGFAMRPVARHEALGSANAVAMFPETYLELASVDGAIPDLRAQYESRFERGPGLAHVSLASRDLGAERARLIALGHAPGPPLDGRRKVTLADGRAAETASLSMYNWTAPHRYLSLFFSEHRRPETIFIEGFMEHPNGTLGLAGIVAASRDPGRDLAYYRDSWDREPEWRDARGFAMRGDRGDLTEVVTFEELARRYGPLVADVAPGSLGGYPVALRCRVADLAATESFLAGRGVETVTVGAALSVHPVRAHGVMLLFEEQAGGAGAPRRQGRGQ